MKRLVTAVLLFVSNAVLAAPMEYRFTFSHLNQQVVVFDEVNGNTTTNLAAEDYYFSEDVVVKGSFFYDPETPGFRGFSPGIIRYTDAMTNLTVSVGEQIYSASDSNMAFVDETVSSTWNFCQ